MYDIIVLGAGIVGLSTAVNIQDQLPGRRITIIADQFTTDTTSDGAAGSFRVTTGLTPVSDLGTFKRWCEVSFQWYHKLNTEFDPRDTGVIRVSGYQLADGEEELPYHRQFIYDFRILSPEELKKLPGDKRYGWSYTTLMTESRRYLPWLTQRFKDGGGNIETRHITDITEFAGRCNVLVNCLGMEAGRLFNDNTMFGVRGHLIRVKADWLKHFYVWDEGSSYIYVGQDNVVLGGTRLRDHHDDSDAEQYYSQIMEKCYKMIPALKNAEIVRKWTGLRPHRNSIRVERESLNINGQELQVVHNYGHGANGIALSWGTSVDAASLVRDASLHARKMYSKL